METKANYTLIGAFTVLSLFVAAVFAVWLANAGLDRSYQRYDVVFDGPVRGLEPGGEVRFNGIKVGEVLTLNLNPSNPKEVVARIRVDSATPVKIDSLAQLEPAGLTGLAYIQILAGGEASPALRAGLGEAPPVIASRKGQLDRLFSGGEGVLQTTLQALSQLNDLLSEQNIGALSRSLTNIEKVTAEISREGSVIDNADTAAVAITEAGQGVSALSRALTELASPNGAYGRLGDELVNSTRSLSGQTSSLLTASEQLIINAGQDIDSLSGGSELAIAEAVKALQQANSTMEQVGGAASALQQASGQLGTAATGVSQAAVTIDGFFGVATRQTLPDVSRASIAVSAAATSFDEIAQDVQNDPTALVSPAPQREVRWPQ